MTDPHVPDRKLESNFPLFREPLAGLGLAAEGIYKPVFQGLPTGKHAAIGEFPGFSRRKIPACFHHADKHGVKILHHGLDRLTRLRRKRLHRIGLRLQHATLNGFRFNTYFFKQLCHIGGLHQHADGARNGAGMREDTVRRNRNHVRRRCCRFTHNRNDRLLFRKFLHTVKKRFTADDGTRHTLSGGEPVSMNMWGFTPAIFAELRRGFGEFLATSIGHAKTEFLLPAAVQELISTGRARVKVLRDSGQW